MRMAGAHTTHSGRDDACMHVLLCACTCRHCLHCRCSRRHTSWSATATSTPACQHAMRCGAPLASAAPWRPCLRSRLPGWQRTGAAQVGWAGLLVCAITQGPCQLCVAHARAARSHHTPLQVVLCGRWLGGQPAHLGSRQGACDRERPRWRCCLAAATPHLLCQALAAAATRRLCQRHHLKHALSSVCSVVCAQGVSREDHRTAFTCCLLACAATPCKNHMPGSALSCWFAHELIALLAAARGRLAVCACPSLYESLHHQYWQSSHVCWALC
jgi:hypothetical protein